MSPATTPNDPQSSWNPFKRVRDIEALRPLLVYADWKVFCLRIRRMACFLLVIRRVTDSHPLCSNLSRPSTGTGVSTLGKELSRSLGTESSRRRRSWQWSRSGESGNIRGYIRSFCGLAKSGFHVHHPRSRHMTKQGGAVDLRGIPPVLVKGEIYDQSGNSYGQDAVFKNCG